MRMKYQNTEAILNRAAWSDSYGNITELEHMEKDHLQNILLYLYKNRDRYWLKCQDTSLIERFENGEEFFQVVIRNSTLWNAILDELQEPVDGFNFDFDLPIK